ncbi:hypothetical protein AAFN90_13390, partial [Erwiniaceae bacterium CAU 1747]
NTLSSFGVNFFLRSFFRRFRQLSEPPTRWPVSRCSVSVEAQYRDFLAADKFLLQTNYQASFF